MFTPLLRSTTFSPRRQLRHISMRRSRPRSSAAALSSAAIEMLRVGELDDDTVAVIEAAEYGVEPRGCGRLGRHSRERPQLTRGKDKGSP